MLLPGPLPVHGLCAAGRGECLRDIEAYMRAQPCRRYHFGTRSTVARYALANAARDWQICADSAQDARSPTTARTIPRACCFYFDNVGTQLALFKGIEVHAQCGTGSTTCTPRRRPWQLSPVRVPGALIRDKGSMALLVASG